MLETSKIIESALDAKLNDKFNWEPIPFFSRSKIAAIADHEIRTGMKTTSGQPLWSIIWNKEGLVTVLKRQIYPEIVFDQLALGTRKKYNYRMCFMPSVFFPLVDSSINLFGLASLVSIILPKTYWRNIIHRLVRDLNNGRYQTTTIEE